MSVQHSSPSARSACKYNSTTAEKLVGPRGIPPRALEAYPDLAEELSSIKFYQAVKAFQVDCMGEAARNADGKLGPMTWHRLLSHFQPVMAHDNYIVERGRRVLIGGDAAPYRVLNFDQSGGYSLHEAGHFTPWGNQGIDRVIMHWGGLDPKHLHAVMNVPDRKVSTHFGIGLIEGIPTVCQYIDLAHKSWHAGVHNTNSVGIDICQQPVYKWSSRYKDLGYDIKKIKNPTDRGNTNILSLEPRIASATRAFVRDLMDVLGLNESAPDHHGVVSDPDQYTLLGHHHLTSRKWDIACWWNDVFTD